VGVTTRLTPEVIRLLVTSGDGDMRTVPGITDVEISAVIQYLGAGGGRGGGGGNRGGGGGPAPVFPPGPVVGRGGVQGPPIPQRNTPLWGGQGPTGGNWAYPPDVTDVPSQRYATGYNVMGASTKPPYTRLVAYDLNQGRIKWQVPIGDHPQTIARGGPTNTGATGLRTGIMPTKAGIVFMAGGDGKVRAYDEDNGNVLWTGTLPGGSRGVPVIYQAKGRQYLVVASTAGNGRGGGGGGGQAAATAPPISPNTPRGYIAFALPRK
jgi:quinoprotein glucose dehydrogenase